VDYAAGVLREAGWEVTVQEVPMRLPVEESPPRLEIGSLGELEHMRDFRAPAFSGAGSGSGALRPVEGGCSPSDYAELEPGDVALVPHRGCFGFVQARNAERAGARALLIADETEAPAVLASTMVFPAPLPVLALRGAVAERLRPGDEVSFEVDTSVERGSTQNVIAEAGEGERVAMAGAHLDSVPGGPGINDNGSGVAVLLATAQQLGPRPGGRVRLAFWGAEELGLYGSRRYVDELSENGVSEIAGYLNLDMVGSPNAVPAVYEDGDARLTELLRRTHPGDEEGVPAAGRSDNLPFEDAGVPVSGLYTGSEEPGPGGRPRDPCYHLPCDRLAGVDREVLLGMAKATGEALAELARQAK